MIDSPEVATPILKLSQTVAIEHDYNKGLPSDDETIDNKPTSPLFPRLVPAGHMEPEVILKRARIDLTRSAIHDINTTSPVSKPKTPSRPGKSKIKNGCRCGLATAKPGNLTCCGQRCPCYSAFKGCVDCRCRGCRNPRGDPMKNPLAALRLHHVQQQTTIEVQIPVLHQEVLSAESEDSDIEIDV